MANNVSCNSSPQRGRRGRPRKSAPTQTYRTPTTQDPLENLPDDLNHNFAQWFYGGFTSFRRHTKENPLRDLRPLVQRFLLKNINNELELGQNKYMTEDLEQEELEPLKCIYSYKVTIDKTETMIEHSNTGKKHQSAQPGDIQSEMNSGKFDVNLRIHSDRTYIDRRSMLLKRDRQEKDASSTMASGRTWLIGPGENCDSDDEYQHEVIEIDCDNNQL